MEKNVFIHIGYPKAASTWLQNQLFPNAIDTYFCPRHLSGKIVSPYINKYDEKAFRREIEERAKDRSNIIISDERLLGGMLTGGYNGFATKVIAERLYATFPNAKIIMFIRNQYDIIASTYLHYIHFGGTFSFNRFFYNPGYYEISKIGMFHHEFFDYWKLYAMYVSLFGKENICVFLFEEFIANIKSFISDFSKKIQLRFNVGSINFDPENTGMSYKDAMLKRWTVNRFTHYNIPAKQFLFSLFYRPDKMWKPIFRPEKNRTKLVISKKVYQEITNLYQKDNEKLFLEIGVDRKKYGYP